jgi:hypothetical protein
VEVGRQCIQERWDCVPQLREVSVDLEIYAHVVWKGKLLEEEEDGLITPLLSK